MHSEKLALRYAHSLLEFAQGKNSLDKVKGDVDAIIDTLDTSRELQVMLKNPLIHYTKKSAIFDSIFKGKISAEVLEFLHVIFRKGREMHTADILRQFVKLYNNEKGILEVQATFATPPSEQIKSELKSALEQKLKGSVILSTDINPAIIGGFSVQYNDVMYDASVAGRLNKLKQALKTN